MCNEKCMGGMCICAKIGKILLIIGGVNWGLVGVGMFMDANLNIVNILLGSMPMIEAVVYILVGVAAVMSLIGCKCKKCKEACASCTVGAGAKTGEGMM